MVATAGLSQGAHVQVNGAALTAEIYGALIDVRVERSLSVASRFTLRFQDPEFQLLDSDRFAVGNEIKIDLSSLSGDYVTVVNGEVVSLGVEQSGGERHELIVTGYDRSHRLGHETKVRTFQNQTYGDVIGSIAREHGLRAKIAPSSEVKFEYLLQTTTDFAFITEMALRTGCEWSVDDTTLVFRPRPEGASEAQLTFGEDLRRFRARYSAAEHATGVMVRGWNASTHQAVVGENTAVFSNPPGGSHPPLHDEQRKEAKATFGGKLRTGTFGAHTQDEATVLSKALAGRVAASEFMAKGEAIGRPDLKAGTTVTVKGLGKKLSGTYYVTSVEHVLGAGRPLMTRFTIGGLEPSSLVDLLGSGDARIKPWGALGVTIGIVTNNYDQKRPGQVKVKYPALSDDVESGWARLASVGAGSGRGMMFMPEVNDEVLVAFEQGDVRRPYVLGGVWDQQQPLPVDAYVEGNKVITGVIKTRRGHVLAFKDGETPADRHFSVLLADGSTKLFVGEEKVELWATDGKPLQLKSGQATVTLKNQGDIEMKGINITIDAQQALKLSGTNVEIKANAALTAEATGQLQLKGTGPSKLESAAILEIKGTLLKFN